MQSVVLGRATRACVIHITGITCEGVAVSSDVFDSPARRRGKFFYLRRRRPILTEKELPAAAIPVSALTVFVTRAGKASRSDQSTICCYLFSF